MYRALAYKELRETWWLGAIAFLVLATHIWSAVGLHFDLERLAIRWGIVRTTIPFTTGELDELLLYTASILGAALACWQTLGESFRGTWRFLRQRPMSLNAIVLTKIGTGLALLLGTTAIPVLFYALWAATPQTHASPFQWSMTVPTWRIWLVSSTAYLAAFLVGIRDVRWYGSRLWPAAPAVVWVWLVSMLDLPALVPTLVINSTMVAAILFAAAGRDE